MPKISPRDKSITLTIRGIFKDRLKLLPKGYVSEILDQKLEEIFKELVKNDDGRDGIKGSIERTAKDKLEFISSNRGNKKIEFVKKSGSV